MVLSFHPNLVRCESVRRFKPKRSVYGLEGFGLNLRSSAYIPKGFGYEAKRERGEGRKAYAVFIENDPFTD